MKTLADEILDALPDLLRQRPEGATVEDVTDAVCAPAAHVRAAMKTLHDDGRALFFRYPASRRMHLAFAETLGRRLVCPHCAVAFERPKKSRRVNCSRSCANAQGWKQPGAAEHRKIAIRASKATPEARAYQIEHNRRRWSDPEQHERLSEQNRQRWADPAQRARRSAGIQAVNGSPAKRAEASANRKALWADPDYRVRAEAGIKASKSTAEYRAWMAQEMKRRWADPTLREKYLAATAKNSRRAAASRRGVSQTAEHLARRLAASARTKAARPHKQSAEHIRKRIESIARNRAARLAAQTENG